MSKRLGVCDVDGCGRRRFALTWCQAHYRRWMRDGDPTVAGPLKGEADPFARYWSKVDRREAGDCWPWLGTITNGYGSFWILGRQRPAHQIAWELANGKPFPAPLVADHLCHNVDLACNGGTTCPHRRCQNPAHLEPVTDEVNTIRGQTGHRKPRKRWSAS